MRKFLRVPVLSAIVLILSAIPCFAQAPTLSSWRDTVQNSQGQVIPAATVTVLAGTIGGALAVNTTTQPGTPLATIYSDPYGASPINQTTTPLNTRAGNGSFQFWAAPGYYVVQIYGRGINGQITYGITIGGAGTAVTLTPGQIGYGCLSTGVCGDGNLLWDTNNIRAVVGLPAASFAASSSALLDGINDGRYSFRALSGTDRVAGLASFVQTDASTALLTQRGIQGTVNITNASPSSVNSQAVGIAAIALVNGANLSAPYKVSAFAGSAQVMSNANVSDMRSVDMDVNTNGTGTIANAYGNYFGLGNHSTGTVTAVHSFFAEHPINDGGGTIGTSYGFHAETQAAANAGYGFYSDDPGLASGHYAYYAAGGKNYFGPLISTFSAVMQTVLTNNPGGYTQFAVMDPVSPLEANTVVATQSNNGTNPELVSFFGYLEQDGSTNLVNKIRNAGEFTVGYNSTGSADANTQLWGVGGSFQHGSTGVVNTAIGVEGQSSTLATGAMITNAIGVEGRVGTNIASSTVVNGYFFKATPWGNMGSSTNLYGYYAGSTAGLATHNYGVYVEDFGAGSNDYAVYVAGGKAHYGGPVDAPQITAVAAAFSGTCNAGAEGTTKAFTDSTTNTWGATISGSGSFHVLGYCDGTNWTVAAK